MNKKIEVIENTDHVLIKTSEGEYHFSLEDYAKLDKESAIEYAVVEIEKKNKTGQYNARTINFKQAESLGFCTYGIKDFAKMVGVDINEDYTILELNKMLTLEALKEYPSECLKLFGDNCIKYLGTVEELISIDTIDLFLREEFIDAKKLHQLSVKFAYLCLSNFEDEFPEDKRPRTAIETKEEWIAEKIALGDF